MKKSLKQKLSELGILLLIALPFILVIIIVILSVVAFVKYSNTPITEVPLWAYLFLKK